MFYCNTPNVCLNPSLTVLSSLMCMYVKLTDLQILGCELHKNAFGASSLTRCMSYSAPQASKGEREAGKRNERIGNSMER